MFGLGMPEILLILAIALIVIGPKRLPDLAKTLGRAMGEFKRATTDFKNSIDLDTGVDDIKSSSTSVRRNINEAKETGKEGGGTDSESKDSSAKEAGENEADHKYDQYADTKPEDSDPKRANFNEEESAREDTPGTGQPDEQERKKNSGRPDSRDESDQVGTRAD